MAIITNRRVYIFFQWLIIILLTAVLAVTLYIGVRNFEYIRLRAFTARRQIRGQRINPEQIQPWMTFRYLNSMFALPTDYFKNTLNITDQRYPNISIATLAKQQKISSAAMLNKTVETVRIFLRQ